MTPDFQTKLQDFSKWCITASDLYKHHHYSEALMNMRKAGESLCKLLLHYKHNDKYAEKLVAGKSYNELIAIVKKNELAPPAILNSLETLQIHGNMAVHDSDIRSEQASLALNVVRLMVRWLFETHLKTPVPANLKIVFEKETAAKKEVTKADAGSEALLQKLTAEKAALEKQVEYYHQSRTYDAAQMQQLKDEIKRSAQQIESLKGMAESNKREEEKVTTPEPEIKKENEKNIQPAEQKTRSFKWMIAAASVVLVAIAGVAFYIVKNKKQPALASVPAVVSDSVNCTLLPFTVLQDNPNINLKFEEMLLSNLRQGVIQFNIPVRINFDTSYRMSAANFNDMNKYAENKKENLVIAGDVFERVSNDSNAISVRILMRKNSQMITEVDLGSFSFVKLTDSNAVSITRHCMNVLQIAAADFYMNTNPMRISNATAILYQVQPLNQLEAGMVSKLLGQCLMLQKKYAAAEIELKKYIAAYPAFTEGYFTLAQLYETLKRYEDAEIYYKKALAISPCDANLLLSYAALLSYPEMNGLDESKKLAQTAMRCDSNNIKVWHYMGELAQYDKKYDKAIDYFNRALKINDSFPPSHEHIAEIYLMQHNDKAALPHLNKLLMLDSLNMYALNRLAGIYQRGDLNDLDKAAIYMKRAQQLAGDTTLATKFNLAMNAFYQQLENALPALLEYYKNDTNKIDINNAIYQCYYKKGDYAKAKEFLDITYSMDSMSADLNYNCGYFYSHTPPPYSDYNKAIRHFKIAVMVNKYDTTSYENLLGLLAEQRAAGDLLYFSNQLLSIDPMNYHGLKGRCLAYSLQQDAERGLDAFKTALKIYPEDEQLNSECAVFLLQNNKNKLRSVAEYALVHAKKAVAINPSRADNHSILAQVYYYLRNNNAAIKEYQEAIRLDPAMRSVEFEKLLAAPN